MVCGAVKFGNRAKGSRSSVVDVENSINILDFLLQISDDED